VAAEQAQSALGSDLFLHHLRAGVLFQRVEDSGDGHAVLLGEPRPCRVPLERAVAAPLVPVLDIGGQRTPHRLEFPDGLVAINLWHIVPKRACELAIRLGVLGRGMDEPDTQVPTEGLQQFPAKHGAIVKDYGLGHHLPLAHGGTQGGNGGPRIDVIEEITEHIGPGIVV
jgi:hypothetical protein